MVLASSEQSQPRGMNCTGSDPYNTTGDHGSYSPMREMFGLKQIHFASLAAFVGDIVEGETRWKPLFLCDTFFTSLLPCDLSDMEWH